MKITNSERVRQTEDSYAAIPRPGLFAHCVLDQTPATVFKRPSLARKIIRLYGRHLQKPRLPGIENCGVDDHTHLLTRHAKTMAISDFLRELKRSSSTWIKTKSRKLSSFHWQDGYGAFSISPSHVKQVETYITNQEAHHRKESFRDEFRRLCKKYGVAIDERYVWD